MSPEAKNAAEARLALFLAKDEPPPRDLVFEARMAIRLSQEKVNGAALARLPMFAAGAAVLWALMQGGGAGSSDSTLVIALAGAVLVGSFLLVRRQFQR